jgi:hypothetical protein
MVLVQAGTVATATSTAFTAFTRVDKGYTHPAAVFLTNYADRSIIV